MDSQNGAPPWDVYGKADSAAVGAHTAHLTASEVAGAVSCGVCHVVPADALSPGHIDGDGQAEVVLSDSASGIYDPNAGSCSSVYCHGKGSTPTTGGSSTWSGGAKTCQSCHTDGGLGGKHSKHLNKGYGCSSCHNVTGQKLNAPETHVDGTKDIKSGLGFNPGNKSCSSAPCHGTKTW
jgi:predicted CxxxxCH...CXXCH cytochrome family protein